MKRPRPLLFVVLTTWMIAGPALARPIKVALTITKDTGGLRKAVAGALDDSDVEVTSAKRTARAIERLGLDDVTSARDARKLASELDVDTVVEGAFDDEAHKLKLTIFTDGKKRGSFSVRADNPKSETFRKAVRTKMLATLAPPDDDKKDAPAAKTKKDASKKDTSADGDDAPMKESSSKTKKDAHADEAARDDKPAKDTRKAKHDADTKPDDDASPARVASADHAGDADEPPTTVQAHAEPVARGANLPAVRVDLGASMSGRSMQFRSDPITNAPAGYRNKPVAGGRIEAELYPLASGTGTLAGLGLAMDFDQTASLAVSAPDTGAALKVTERHYSIGARYRIAIGHRPTSPTVTVGVGYAARTFAVDRGGTMTAFDLPDVDYRMIDPGLAVRVPLGTRVAVTAAGRALLLLSAGAIAEPDQYGRAHVTGGSGSAGLEVVLARRVALRVAAEITQLDLSFYGTGMLATSRDGDPTTIDVHGAVDRYYGGAATLALVY